jgi:GAF domain
LRAGTPSGNGQAPIGRAPVGSSSSAASSFVGKSLAEMAQSDLDAALQLLADRAQYITGSTGAAIALRRRGMKDMMCRASSGANAPELGALLSTEVGLSGESVRTRQAMRCDDTEMDARVNRDVCRQMGIASVVVMPVVHDDEVLGVFELFSGKINAFGERDLSALQRLSTMVETAVGLASAAEEFPALVQGVEPVASTDTSVEVQVQAPGAGQELMELGGAIVDEPTAFEPMVEVEAVEPVTAGGEIGGPDVPAPQTGTPQVFSPQIVVPQIVVPQVVAEKKTAGQAAQGDDARKRTSSAAAAAAAPARQPMGPPSGAEVAADLTLSRPISATPMRPAPAPAQSQNETAAPRKVLFWSAANAMAEQMQAEADQSHLPAVLRHLRKCEACGFPISSGRALCVDCEEKKWRGQGKVNPATKAAGDAATAGLSQPVASVSNRLAAAQMSPPAPRAFAAAADAQAGAALVAARRAVASAAQILVSGGEATGLPSIPAGVQNRPGHAPESAGQAVSPAPAKAVSTPVVSAPLASTTIPVETKRDSKPATSGVATPSAASCGSSEHKSARPPELVLSAAAAPERSWLSANKFIICALVVVAGVIAAVFFLR